MTIAELWEAAIPTLDDLPELTPEQEAEALADAEVLARRLATDELLPPLSKGQEVHLLVETARWGPRRKPTRHRGVCID